MNGKRLLVGIILLFALAGVSFAATPLGQGLIQFHDSIVEPGCTSLTRMSSTFQFNGCPTPVGSAVSVRSVESVRSVSLLDHSSVNVKLLAVSGRDGRYYDQQYELVDGTGKPVRSGTYLITLTSP